MASDSIVRQGALTEDSLVSAISTERANGRRVEMLHVAADLEERAVGIVGSARSALDAVRSSIARVSVDAELAPGEWRLA